MKIKLNVKALSMSCCTTSQIPTKKQFFTHVQSQKENSVKLTNQYPVAIISAGPVGLAAAAHLSLAGIPFSLLEKVLRLQSISSRGNTFD